VTRFDPNTCRRRLGGVCLCVLLVLPALCPAADTLEAFEQGASNLDFGVSIGGLGQHRSDATFRGEVMAGYGLTPRMSAYVVITRGANGFLGDGSGGFAMGMYGTPLEGDRWDLDLIFDVGAGDPDLAEFAVSPGFELNYDDTPDQSTWGFYANGGAALYGHAEQRVDTAVSEWTRTAMDIPLTIGTYRAVSDGQLFFQAGTNIHDLGHTGLINEGVLAFGYNFNLTPTVEMITELAFAIYNRPDAEAGIWDLHAADIYVGLISTL